MTLTTTELQELKDLLLARSYHEEGPLDTPCLIWGGACQDVGYGHLTYKQKNYKVHRLSLYIATGIPPKLNVLHRCDNRACWAEDHLFEGTQQDNVDDMIAKGRRKINPNAKLTLAQVAEIRRLLLADKHTLQEIGDMFGVSGGTICLIKKGETWITPPTRSTDDVIAEVLAAGFLINNLFQCNTQQYQANLRNDIGLTQFCIAATPAEALEGCLLLLNDLVPPRENLGGFSIEARASLSDLINNQPTRNPINRRF